MLVGDVAVATTAATATPTLGAALSICSTSLACSSDSSDCCLFTIGIKSKKYKKSYSQRSSLSRGSIKIERKIQKTGPT